MREPHEADGLLDMLIEWLGEMDMRKFVAAAKVFLWVGPPVVPFLIQAAVNPATGVEHQRRLLDLAQRIGGPLGLAERLGLLALRRHGHPANRMKAEQILLSLLPPTRSRRPPPSKRIARLLRSAAGNRPGTRRPQGVPAGRKSMAATGRPSSSSFRPAGR